MREALRALALRIPRLVTPSAALVGCAFLYCAALSGCSASQRANEPAASSTPATAPVASGDKVVVDVPFGAYRLVVSRLGDAPRLISKSCIMGDGLQATIEGTGWCAGGGEIDPPVQIDYSKAANGELTVTYYARDPQTSLRGEYGERWAPFVRERVAIDHKGELDVRDAVVMTKEKFDPGRAEQLYVAFFKGDGDDDCLASLRNMGLDKPEPVMAIFRRIAANPKCDGALAESLATFRGELQWATDITGGARNPHSASSSPAEAGNPQ
jgi:hypothetical protein